MRRISLALFIASFALTITVGCDSGSTGPVTPVKPVLPKNSTANTNGRESVLPEEGP